MNARIDKFIKLVSHPVKFRMLLVSKLPSAYFSGVKLKHIDAKTARVSVPYKWFSQNPFGSTYFACLAMAAEMSTGLLGMMHSYQTSPRISMLVLAIEGNFYKKAKGLTNFTCDGGDSVAEIIREALDSPDGRSIKLKSTGLNAANELVAEFYITWSFKASRGG